MILYSFTSVYYFNTSITDCSANLRNDLYEYIYVYILTITQTYLFRNIISDKTN